MASNRILAHYTGSISSANRDCNNQFPSPNKKPANSVASQIVELWNLVVTKSNNNHERMHAAFVHFDVMRRGHFNLEEFRDGVRRYGWWSEEPIEHTFKWLADDKDTVNYQQFLIRIRDLPKDQGDARDLYSVRTGKSRGIGADSRDQKSVFWSSLTAEQQQITLRELVLQKVYQQKSNLLSIFRLFDRNRDGYLSIDELQDVLLHLGIDVEKAFLAPLMARFDRDGDGRVNLHEFVLALDEGHFTGEEPATRDIHRETADHKRLQPTYLPKDYKRDVALREAVRSKLNERALTKQKAFLRFQPDGRGIVSYENYATALINMGLSVSEDDLQRIVELTDVDNEGCLDFQTFCNFISKCDEEAAGLYAN